MVNREVERPVGRHVSGHVSGNECSVNLCIDGLELIRSAGQQRKRPRRQFSFNRFTGEADLAEGIEVQRRNNDCSRISKLQRTRHYKTPESVPRRNDTDVDFLRDLSNRQGFTRGELSVKKLVPQANHKNVRRCLRFIGGGFGSAVLHHAKASLSRGNRASPP